MLASAVSAWLQAARPLAQINIAMPLLLGQALAHGATGRVDMGVLALVLAMGVFDHLFIVFANDVADEVGDRAHVSPSRFSGGSRVLPEGKLDARSLGRAARAMAVALLVLATCTGVMFDRPLLPVAWALGVVLLWLYSYSPGRLSYRGHGEWVAGLGVGVLLPLIGWYAQTGELAAFPWLALVPLFLLGLASNINTALPDHVADARVAKRTWSVRYGSARARKHSLQLLAIAVLFTPWVLPGAAKSTWLAVECVPLLLVLLNARQLRRADPADPPQCSRFVFRNGLAGTALMVGWIVALSLREFGSS